MKHFIDVYVVPDRPVLIRLPYQKSPIKDAYKMCELSGRCFYLPDDC